MIRVVNVRTHKGPAVYVGRACHGRPAHPLGNPFRLPKGAGASERQECLARYRRWLEARPDLADQLRRLWEQTEAGILPLACWCHPLDCHAAVLAEHLQREFGNGDANAAVRVAVRGDGPAVGGPASGSEVVRPRRA